MKYYLFMDECGDQNPANPRKTIISAPDTA